MPYIIAKRLDTFSSVISDIEHGKIFTTYANIEKIAAFTSVDVDWLVAGEKNHPMMQLIRSMDRGKVKIEGELNTMILSDVEKRIVELSRAFGVGEKELLDAYRLNS